MYVWENYVEEGSNFVILASKCDFLEQGRPVNGLHKFRT